MRGTQMNRKSDVRYEWYHFASLQEWYEIWVISLCFTTRVIWDMSDITLLHYRSDMRYEWYHFASLQEWCEIWVISFCFTTRVIWNTSDITLLHSKIWIQESHTELSSFFNQVYGTYSSFYQLYGHIRRVYTVNLRHEPPHLPLGCGWHHKLQHSHDDSLKDFGLGLK
jgi:hypothetical protein